MSIDLLTDFRASYMTHRVAILFKQDPTLDSIAQARKILDDITDQLVIKAINEDIS